MVKLLSGSNDYAIINKEAYSNSIKKLQEKYPQNIDVFGKES